jgi:hypothetical protein
MKKFFLFALSVAWLHGASAHALDPLASRDERSKGMIFVKTPMPEADTVTLTQIGGSATQTLKPNDMRWVEVGDYTVSVKMGDYKYDQNVTVRPTERTDVVVPGFGNLKVSSINSSDNVEVFKRGGKSLVTKFPASQIKTLPTGHYDVKVIVGNTSITKDNVYVVTNTTREVVVSYKLSTR